MAKREAEANATDATHQTFNPNTQRILLHFVTNAE